MEQRMITANWCPETFEEFYEQAAQNCVRLGILPEQYGWLYENILPFNVFRCSSYKKRLLKSMMRSETTFRQVHTKGIDLVLFECPIED